MRLCTVALWTHLADSGVEVSQDLNCQSARGCQGEVLRLQERLGTGWYPSSVSSRTFLTLSHLPWAIFVLHTGVLSAFGSLAHLGVMDKEGVSLLAPTFAPASKRPHFLLPISVTV